MLGSAGNVMLQMSAPCQAPQTVHDRTAEEVLRQARIEHGSRMATLAQVNRVVDERSTSRQRRSSLIRMQFDKPKPPSVFDDTAYAYALVSTFSDTDSMEDTSDGIPTESDTEESSGRESSSVEFSVFASKKTSEASKHGRPQPINLHAIPIAQLSSHHSNSRRLVIAGTASANLADINPSENELVCDDLFAKCVVRFRDPESEGISCGSSSGHSQLRSRFPAPPAFAWADETSVGGGSASVLHNGNSPRNSESASPSSHRAAPGRTSDTCVKVAVSPQVGSALATLLANSQNSGLRTNIKRVSTPGTGLPSLRASATSTLPGTWDFGSDAVNGLPPRVGASAGSGSSASSGYMGAVKMFPFPVLSTSITSQLLASSSTSPPLQQPPTTGPQQQLQTQEQPSPMLRQEQQQAGARQQATAVLMRTSRDRVSSNGTSSALPLIVASTNYVASCATRTPSPNPIPNITSSASLIRGLPLDTALTAGVEAIGRAAAPAVSCDPRDIPGSRRSVTGAPASSILVSNSWSGASWPIRPSSGCSNRAAPEENLPTCRSGVVLSMRHQLQQQRPQRLVASCTRTGPLLRPAPKEPGFTQGVTSVAATAAEAGASAKPANLEALYATKAPQPPPSTQPQTPQLPLPERKSLTLKAPTRTHVGDSATQCPRPPPSPPPYLTATTQQSVQHPSQSDQQPAPCQGQLQPQ